MFKRNHKNSKKRLPYLIGLEKEFGLVKNFILKRKTLQFISKFLYCMVGGRGYNLFVLECGGGGGEWLLLSRYGRTNHKLYKT